MVMSMRWSYETHLHDLPDEILNRVFGLVEDTRSRNAMALVCRRWRCLERATRTSLTLRGNVHDLYLIPTTFQAVTHLDLSLLSPWGHSIFDAAPNPVLLAHRLAQAFPSLTSLSIYARAASALRLLAPRFPALKHVRLVRWHQRTQNQPLGSDFEPLLASCPSLSSLDLSHFYFWTEDLPPALQAHGPASTALTRLNLLALPSPDGFKSLELLAIAQACPNLTHLLVACVFDPRYLNYVGDDALLALASSCPRLSLLHLADASSLSNPRGDLDDDGPFPGDAGITRPVLEEVFAALPLLQELTLDVRQNVRDTGPALEILNSKCPQLRLLTLGQFHGICSATNRHLDGVALCSGLESLSIMNSADLSDSGLLAISMGCPRLARFAIQGCKLVTERGMKRLTRTLRHTLVDVSISCCEQLDTGASLRGLEPIQDRIQRLHVDCIRDGIDESRGKQPVSAGGCDFDLNEFHEVEESESRCFAAASTTVSKQCRYMNPGKCSGPENWTNGLWSRTWKRLQYLSVWVEVGELLSLLPKAGLENCPELEEIKIKVEGDCRRRPKPTQPDFGLSSLGHYPRLRKMQLDCGDTIGYALTAPSGYMDLSLWERFFLRGIETLSLGELDYWPPQDRDVNNRSLSLPAAGLLSACATLRKLFIHGTAHEHFMMFFLNIPNLRDVQLREDYYPAPENEMSTEMRVGSCSRFEEALNRRRIAD